MLRLQIIILSLVPLCLGQFSIQGPSDGNRRAQGLKYSADKGVEYTDQAASLGTGGFSITGASDGNSNFQIQGATDGNADFRIQGATDGNSEFQIHGPTDGGSQAYLQNYQPAQEQPQQPANQGRALQYQDPSGHRVNWRAYNRAAEKVQPRAQYEEPAPRPVQRRPTHRRTQSHAARAQPQPQPQPQAQPEPQQRYQQAPVANINYNPIEKAPPSIQEILQFQAQIPYVNIIPEHLRFDALSAAKAQAQKFAEEYPKQVLAQQPAQLVIEEAPRSQYRPRPRQHQQQREHAREQQQRVRRQASDIESYILQQEGQQLHLISELQAFIQQQDRQLEQQHKRRQAQQYAEEDYRQQQRQQPQQQQQQQYPAQKAYRRLTQPPPEHVPQYSQNVPEQIQEILRFQARIPYDVIANQIVYRPEKPYVPHPVEQPAPAQYKAAEAPEYASQEQQQQFVKPQPAQQQSQNLGYYTNQRSTPRPVNEQQY